MCESGGNEGKNDCVVDLLGEPCLGISDFVEELVVLGGMFQMDFQAEGELQQPRPLRL